MQLKLLRRDFVPEGTLCIRQENRRHGFPTGAAWILSDGEQEYPYGPDCAAIVMGEDIWRESKRSAPDFTTRDVEVAQQHQGHGGGGAGRAHTDDNASRTASALRYLLLRMERLPSLPGISPQLSNFKPLQQIHQHHARGHDLDLDQVRHVLNIEAKARTSNYKFSEDNLLDVYTAYYRLSRLYNREQNPNNKAWIANMKEALLKNLWLSEKQLATLKKLKLHPRAFPPGHAPGSAVPRS